MPVVLVDPLDETLRPKATAAARLPGLAGKTIGLLDIGKPGGSAFLDRVEALLKQWYDVGAVVRVMKPAFTRPAPDEVIDRLFAAPCDAVIEALAD